MILKNLVLTSLSECDIMCKVVRDEIVRRNLYE